MTREDQLLLILDLDETLIHSRGRADDFLHDFTVGPYFVRRRPHLESFLQECAEFCRIAVWSSAGAEYVDGIVRQILPVSIEPAFVWSRERCVALFDHEHHEEYFVKDLKKLRRKGHTLARTLIVDDEPRKLERNYGNAIYVKPFTGQPEDLELRYLLQYLKRIRNVVDVRTVEKRGWRLQLSVTSGDAP